MNKINYKHLLGHAISRNGMELMRNIPQDAKMRNGYFKAYNGQIYTCID